MTIDVQRPPVDSRLYIVPLLLTCLAYANSLGGDFVHDDLSAVMYNGDVTAAGGSADGSSGRSGGSIWSNDFWGTALSDAKSHKSYRPLTVLSFRFTSPLDLLCYSQTFPKFNTTIRWNYLIGGLNPIGYHVVNVILHGAVTLIFARVCRHQLETTWRTSLISAGLFAIHSIHTEAVSDLL